MTIVSIGEVLWDVFDDSEHLGGAPFNFSVHARRLGHEVIFISAVGEDQRGCAAREAAGRLGLPAGFIQTVCGLQTGVVSVRLEEGQPSYTIHRPAAYDAVALSEPELARLSAARPAWVYFGTLHQSARAGRAATEALLRALPDARRFYDVNLRRESYTAALVLDLLALAQVVKLNEDEAAEINAMARLGPMSPQEFTRHWTDRAGWSAVAVTRGAHGCAVRIGADYAEAPGYAVRVADTVGAGDAFAAGFLHGVAHGWDVARLGEFANRLGAVVAARPGPVPAWTIDDCLTLRQKGVA